MGLVILAGGDGTRLGFTGPKGAFVLDGINKSLFEILISKARSVEAIAIMTSERNHEESIAFFQQHHFFGLDEEKVSFFMQSSTPIQDLNGQLIYDDEGRAITAPCGNGDLFTAFDDAGLVDAWSKKGIEYVQVVPVDNPLAPIYDLAMIAAHKQYNVGLVVRGVEKQSDESIGSLVRGSHGLSVIEYTEEASAAYLVGYTGIFSLCFKWMRKLSDLSTPWHKAYKQRETQKIVKLEKFIFDYFAHIDSFKVLVSDRKGCFAPIKEGQDVYKYKDLLHN